MNDGEFQKIDTSERRMYGPRGILICGYSPEEQDSFLQFIAGLDLLEAPTVFAAEGDSEVSLKDLLARGHKEGLGQPSKMPRTVILSGFTQNEFHTVISSYKKAGFQEQLWAALTPTSENWALGRLLVELGREAEAMNKSRSS